MKITLFFFCVIISLFISSCKNDFEPEKFDLDDDIKALFDFKEGSYWVYENLKTGGIDCTFVSNYEQGYRSIGKNRSHTGKKVEYDIVAYNTWWLGEKVSLSFHVENAYKSTENQIDYRLFTDKYKFGNAVFFNDGKDDRKTIDTLTVRGVLYNDVIIDNRTVMLEDEFLQNYYLKENIGFLKLEFVDSTVYELIRYKVVQ